MRVAYFTRAVVGNGSMREGQGKAKAVNELKSKRRVRNAITTSLNKLRSKQSSSRFRSSPSPYLPQWQLPLCVVFSMGKRLEKYESGPGDVNPARYESSFDLSSARKLPDGNGLEYRGLQHSFRFARLRAHLPEMVRFPWSSKRTCFCFKFCFDFDLFSPPRNGEDGTLPYFTDT